mmetsp:Transcript_100540/g.224637  ORF Transcript_100540/g.224637 Transcript_100540/m.224637 type:complete len:232 (+) Transcript_100540:533-1228(+)
MPWRVYLLWGCSARHHVVHLPRHRAGRRLPLRAWAPKVLGGAARGLILRSRGQHGVGGVGWDNYWWRPRRSLAIEVLRCLVQGSGIASFSGRYATLALAVLALASLALNAGLGMLLVQGAFAQRGERVELNEGGEAGERLSPRVSIVVQAEALVRSLPQVAGGLLLLPTLLGARRALCHRGRRGCSECGCRSPTTTLGRSHHGRLGMASRGWRRPATGPASAWGRHSVRIQ